MYVLDVCGYISMYSINYYYQLLLSVIALIIYDIIILINKMFQTKILFSCSKCVRCVFFIQTYTVLGCGRGRGCFG